MGAATRRGAQSQAQSQSRPSVQPSSSSSSSVRSSGFTDEGEQFLVPATLDTVATLHPLRWSITSVLALSLILVNVVCLLFFPHWSKWPHVLYFLCFRVLYDAGLGWILRQQSEKRSFTKWYSRTLRSVGGKSSKHPVARLFHHLAQSQLVDREVVNVDDLPEAFRAWLVYKNLVNVILINDGINYLLLGVKCAHLPGSSSIVWSGQNWLPSVHLDVSLLTVCQYGIGVFLALFNYWAKVDAHRCIGEYCFTDEHELLTDEGFKNCSQIQQYYQLTEKDFNKQTTLTLNPHASLRFASYNPSTRCIEYTAATHMTMKKVGSDGLISFTHTQAQQTWTGTATAERHQHGQAEGEPSHNNHVSLVVTPNHDMYVRMTTADRVSVSPFTKRKACSLSISPPTRVQLLSYAENGITPSMDKLLELSFVRPLGLNREEQVDAFLLLYGYWLGKGTINSAHRQVCFAPITAADIWWMRSLMARVGLQAGDEQQGYTEHQQLVSFNVKCWFPYFYGEYGLCSPCEISVWQWWTRLSVPQLRLLLSGLCRAEGVSHPDTDRHSIYTCSTRLRDDVLRMCLHAGYAAHFLSKQPVGSASGDTAAEWEVSYSSHPSLSTPVLDSATEIVRLSEDSVSSDTTVFCVTVPPHGLIIARRAYSEPLSGVVTAASLPCIVGNCWYWGDFFFRKEMTLTFNGIFELFPHPMYTVGYSLYYGYSLICRSYTMLFVSLLAHGAQLLFLLLVEEPHIQRVYGNAQKQLDPQHWSQLYDPKSGLFPSRRENVLYAHLDLFRSGDFALLILSVYVLVLSYHGSSSLLVAQVVVWRLLHWLGGGVVLWQQSKRQAWTRHFTEQGRDLYEAFDHWKRTYNLSLTMNAMVFVTCCVHYFHFSFLSLFDAWRMACLVLGCCLVALSIWSFKSTYDAVGDFGWFYGDFFIDSSLYRPSICYTGIYRFLNNPDCVTGYAGQYGAALICQSWTIFFVALFSHALHITFLNCVEIPHMHKLYSESELRSDGPIPRAIKNVTRSVVPNPVRQAQKRMEKQLAGEIRKIRVKALTEMFELYQKMEGKQTTTRIQQGGGSTLTINTNKHHKQTEETSSTSSSTSSGSNGSNSSTPVDGPSPAVSDEDKDNSGCFSPPLSPSPHPNQSYRLFVPQTVSVGSTLTISYTCSGEHTDTDWIGVYPIDTPSTPGASDGHWQYVPVSQSGSLSFPPKLLPSKEGVYEVRYHLNNRYQIVAAEPIILTKGVGGGDAAT